MGHCHCNQMETRHTQFTNKTVKTKLLKTQSLTFLDVWASPRNDSRSKQPMWMHDLNLLAVFILAPLICQSRVDNKIKRIHKNNFQTAFLAKTKWYRTRIQVKEQGITKLMFSLFRKDQVYPIWYIFIYRNQIHVILANNNTVFLKRK